MGAVQSLALIAILAVGAGAGGVLAEAFTRKISRSLEEGQSHD